MQQKLRILTSLISFCALITLLAPISHSQTIEKIVAVVDDNVVLASEMNSRVEAIMFRYQETGTEIPPIAILEQQVLDQLIIERIQLDFARRIGIVISEEEMFGSFQNVAASNGMTVEEFSNVLVQQGGSVNEFLRDLNNDLTINELQRNIINQRIVVTDSEIDRFLDSEEGQFWQTPDYFLGHIQLDLAATASPEEVIAQQNLADDIYNQLQQGADFATLAVRHSSGPSAIEGGDLGWRKPAQFPKEISDVMLRAEIGDVTPPVRSAGGYHLMKVYDKRGGDAPQMVQQTSAQHILIQPNEIRTLEQAYALTLELRNRISSGESFEDLAAEFSDDVSNALKGGDLGWVFPGQMVAPFENAMNLTLEGEISDPVETEFGRHLVKVNERKDVDVTDVVMRNQADSMIRSQRFEEELDIWHQELRSESFIQIVDND